MRLSSFLVPLFLLGTLVSPWVIAGPSPEYQFPDHPVSMHLSVASNGTFAIVGITLSEYGRIPDYMCPIDSPDTYIGCRELSRREYILLEIGDGVGYVNLTGSLAGFNFTAISVVPLGKKWFIVGTREIPPCEFGVCTNVSYTIMEYFPRENRIGRPIHLPQLESGVIFHLPDAMALHGESSRDSLVFSFPYASKTYSVPFGVIENYLNFLNFSDSSGLREKSLMGLFRAVPFRDGILLYLPNYGLEPYSSREYLLIGNSSSVYFPVGWVGHRGFSCIPENASNGSLTKGIFPPLFYYENGRLVPLMNLSTEAYSLSDSGRAFNCIRPVMELSDLTTPSFGGNSTVPELELPRGEGVYVSIVRTVPHYSSENFTLVDLCVNREEILHARLDESGVTFLRTPFPGLFLNGNGSWIYGRLSESGFRNFCEYYRGPAFNETFLYDPVRGTLSPAQPRVLIGTTGEFSSGGVGGVTAVDVPLDNLSECVPNQKAASMLRGVKVGDGMVFYYPFYVAGVALEGRGWATVWGDHSSSAPVPLNRTCLTFYYSDGGIRSLLRVQNENVTVRVGLWDVDLVIPVIRTWNSVNVTPVDSTTGQAEGICGPALVLGLTIVPLLLRKKR